MSADRIPSPADHYTEAVGDLSYAEHFHVGTTDRADLMASALVHATLAAVPWATYAQARDAARSTPATDSTGATP